MDRTTDTSKDVAKKDVANPWSLPIAVAQIPDTGLHRDLEARPAELDALAVEGALRSIISAKASLDVMPEREGRFRVFGSVSARIGQMCVVTLDPIENDIHEEIDLTFAPESQIPALSDLVDEAESSDVEIPDPPEPIVHGMIDLGRVATDALFLAVDPYPRKAGVVFDAPNVPEDPEDHPFAALKALKADEKSDKPKKPKHD